MKQFKSDYFMKNQLRIIAGQWKRRQLDFASIEGLRPTPDRVRETLFNWLMWDIQNANVLDICTGSGALSFEALSRGASHVVMIEPNTQQVDFLKKNLQLLKVQNAKLIAKTAQQALSEINNQQFDIVFIDPPYALDLWQVLAHQSDPLIKDNGLIYIESDRELSLLQLPTHWQLIKYTKAGKVYAGLWQKVSHSS